MYCILSHSFTLFVFWNVSFISERAGGGYKQDRRHALPIFVCVSEDPQELMTIYRIVVENSMVEELYRAAWNLETKIKWHEETTVIISWGVVWVSKSEEQMWFTNNTVRMIGSDNEIRSGTISFSPSFIRVMESHLFWLHALFCHYSHILFPVTYTCSFCRNRNEMSQEIETKRESKELCSLPKGAWEQRYSLIHQSYLALCTNSQSWPVRPPPPPPPHSHTAEWMALATCL